jgi:hypothetical protein
MDGVDTVRDDDPERYTRANARLEVEEDEDRRPDQGVVWRACTCGEWHAADRPCEEGDDAPA